MDQDEEKADLDRVVGVVIEACSRVIAEASNSTRPPEETARLFIAVDVERLHTLDLSDELIRSGLVTASPERFLFDLCITACAYAIHAQRLGPGTPALERIAQAYRLLGCAEASVSFPRYPKDMRSYLGAISQEGKIAKSEQSKTAARQWCEENLDRYQRAGLTQLATACIAACAMQEAHKTVRGWVTEWAKEWRADGRWPPL